MTGRHANPELRTRGVTGDLLVYSDVSGGNAGKWPGISMESGRVVQVVCVLSLSTETQR